MIYSHLLYCMHKEMLYVVFLEDQGLPEEALK